MHQIKPQVKARMQGRRWTAAGQNRQLEQTSGSQEQAWARTPNTKSGEGVGRAIEGKPKAGVQLAWGNQQQIFDQ